MLYDLDRCVAEYSDRGESRRMCDLAYDIESYVIDVMYAENHVSPAAQEKKGRCRMAELIISENERKKLLSFLTPLLCDMGIPRQLKGFRMLEDCVIEASQCLINNKPYYLRNMYPIIAEKYGITENNAEKLCRYACGCINIERRCIVKYPLLDSLTRKSYESVTLGETVEVLTKIVAEKLKIRKKTDRT